MIPRHLVLMIAALMLLLGAFAATPLEAGDEPRASETFEARVLQIQYMNSADKTVRFIPSGYLEGVRTPYLLDHDLGRTFEMTPWDCMNRVCEVTVVDTGEGLQRIVDMRRAR